MFVRDMLSFVETQVLDAILSDQAVTAASEYVSIIKSCLVDWITVRSSEINHKIGIRIANKA